MKWSRKTKEFESADYISIDGQYRIRDMSLKDRARYNEHIRQGYPKTDYWALIKGDEIVGWFKTVKQAKEKAEQ